MQAIARLSAVSKRYGGVTALDRVDLSAGAGQILALLGPNGAGKTTAVRTMMGLVKADSGSVELFGENPTAAAARIRTGVMLQMSGVPDTLTVAEVIGMFRRYYPRPVPLQRLLRSAEIEDIADRRLGRLSGGQRQRVLFAIAVCGNPAVVFLDEPTVGLDVQARRGFWRLIRRLAANGCSILLTTHYLDEADALADRIVVLNRGRVIADGRPEAIKALVPARRIRCRTALAPTEIRGLSGVSGVTEDGVWTEISTPAAEDVLRQLLIRDPGLGGLEVTGARLEDAFMALTEDRREPVRSERGPPNTLHSKPEVRT